ncbi:MAG: hypothetical protein AAGG02_07835 [Cyanobacteria bacterium P01_H01_bin.15]
MEIDVLSKTLLVIGVLIDPLCLLVILGWLSVKVVQFVWHWTRRFYLLRTVPCCSCVYYSGLSELACAVNPCDVLTVNARNCRDFSPTENSEKEREETGITLTTLIKRVLLLGNRLVSSLVPTKQG